jgi:hypothetical protein
MELSLKNIKSAVGVFLLSLGLMKIRSLKRSGQL